MKTRRHILGMAEGHVFPCGRPGQQLAQQLVVHGVAGLVAAEGRNQRMPDDVEVTDGVEDLVPDKFVRKAQPVPVEDEFVINWSAVTNRYLPLPLRMRTA